MVARGGPVIAQVVGVSVNSVRMAGMAGVAGVAGIAGMARSHVRHCK